MTPEICPNCGAEVPPGAKACPECGSDENTGWSEDADLDRLGLPADDFNYDEFVKREFGGKQPKRRGPHWLWWIVALVLAGLFLLAFFR